jgi:hypothetical protein
MSTQADNARTPNYFRLTEALTKVFDIIRDGNLGGSDIIKDINNHLHSVTTEFRQRNQEVLKDHVPVLVDVENLVRNITTEKEKKKEEDKWVKVMVR